jgi:hypothetical protein
MKNKLKYIILICFKVKNIMKRTRYYILKQSLISKNNCCPLAIIAYKKKNIMSQQIRQVAPISIHYFLGLSTKFTFDLTKTNVVAFSLTFSMILLCAFFSFNVTTVLTNMSLLFTNKISFFELLFADTTQINFGVSSRIKNV